MGKWIIDNWGNVASLLGLTISIGVLFISRSARQAALDARKSLEKRSLAMDLRTCMDDIALINVLQENERWELAAHIVYRVIQNIAFLQSRWVSYMDPPTRESLGMVVAQLGTIHRQLGKFQRGGPNEAEAAALSKAISRVTLLLTSETGKCESLLEQS